MKSTLGDEYREEQVPQKKEIQKTQLVHLIYKISGAFLMFGVKTCQQPRPCQYPVALLWIW